ncbi:MAG: hypothetical protein P8R54_07390 [Myxococcota bacterium]|nr:hypothetical protein [Myxococcota bacterium]
MIALLAGCLGLTEPAGLLADCGAGCGEVVVAAWPDDPDGVTAAIVEHPVVEARIAMVSALITAYPGPIGADPDAPLCVLLPPGPTRDRCGQLHSRPHLQLRIPPDKPASLRAGGGPSSNNIRPSRAMRSRLSDTPPMDHDCGAAPDVTGCLIAAAREVTAPAAVVGLCRNIAAESWRGECLFQAAEERVGAEPGAYVDAASLCTLAEPFVQECHHHLIVALAGQNALSAIAASAALLAETWQERDPYMAQITVDRLWSEVVGNRVAVSLAGAIAADLPPHARRHLRASVVAALMASEGAAAHDLAGWVARAQAVLAGGAVVAADDGAFERAVERWPQDGPDEAVRPATFYLGTARRTHATDESADLAICVVEAAARMADGAGLVAQGQGHPDEAVRWTAQRLIRGGP